MTVFWDPKRYGRISVGAIDSRPAAETVAEGSVWTATDAREIDVVKDGEWVKAADLTSGIDWDDLLNKPSVFPPEIHDLDSAHSGVLPIDRVSGHDFYARGHRKLAALGQLNEPF